MTACAKHGRQLGHAPERSSHRLVYGGADPYVAVDAVVFDAQGEGVEAKRGPNTITGKRALLDELEEIQAAGFAVTRSSPSGCTRSRCRCATRRANVVAAVGLAAPGSAILLEELVDALAPARRLRG
jgi:DNA-binding IclR family transcriptional regulator